MIDHRFSIIDDRSSVNDHRSSFAHHPWWIIDHDSRSSIFDHRRWIIIQFAAIIDHWSPVIHNCSSIIDVRSSIFDKWSSIICHLSPIIGHRFSRVLLREEKGVQKSSVAATNRASVTVPGCPLWDRQGSWGILIVFCLRRWISCWDFQATWTFSANHFAETAYREFAKTTRIAEISAESLQLALRK